MCLLCCLSTNQEAVGGSEVPGPAAPVTVAGDLGDFFPCAPAHEQGTRRRVRSKTTTTKTTTATTSTTTTTTSTRLGRIAVLELRRPRLPRLSSSWPFRLQCGPRGADSVVAARSAHHACEAGEADRGARAPPRDEVSWPHSCLWRGARRCLWRARTRVLPRRGGARGLCCCSWPMLRRAHSHHGLCCSAWSSSQRPRDLRRMAR